MVEIENIYRVDGFIFEDIESARIFKSFIEKEKYNQKQKSIIYSGIKNNFDVSLYANSKFNYQQMDQIFIGIKKGFRCFYL